MFSYFLFRSLLLCFLFERSENYTDIAVAFLYGMSGTARNGHVTLHGHSLINADLLYEKSVFVEFEVIDGIGNGGIDEVRERMASFLRGLDENGLGIAYALAADHVGYDADLAGRDTVIFEGCGDHVSKCKMERCKMERLFFSTTLGGGGFGG